MPTVLNISSAESSCDVCLALAGLEELLVDILQIFDCARGEPRFLLPTGHSIYLYVEYLVPVPDLSGRDVLATL